MTQIGHEIVHSNYSNILESKLRMSRVHVYVHVHTHTHTHIHTRTHTKCQALVKAVTSTQPSGACAVVSTKSRAGELVLG